MAGWLLPFFEKDKRAAAFGRWPPRKTSETHSPAVNARASARRSFRLHNLPPGKIDPYPVFAPIPLAYEMRCGSNPGHPGT